MAPGLHLVPYAYNYLTLDNPGGSGARCDALITELERSRIPLDRAEFFFSAGYAKTSTNWPTDKVRLSLACLMARYIRSKNLPGVKIQVADRLAWGTYGETLAAIRHIPSGSAEEVWICTNLGHMPRVWLCWRWLAPQSWKLRFIRADQAFAWKERGQEVIKFFGYLFRFLFVLWPEH